MNERIFGIVPPMTTPFRPDDTIDEAALRAETRYLIETARVHYNVVPWTYLSPALLARIIDAVPA
jgi:dihydrodipicolinate synthase/N-acetylneuraminate lyase